MTQTNESNPEPTQTGSFSPLLAAPLEVLALDHRDSLRVILDPENPEQVPKSLLREIKTDLVRGSRDLVDGFMLDPEIGMEPSIIEEAKEKLVISSLEAQGYLLDPREKHTTLLEGWSADLALKAGASAVKLLALWDGKPNYMQGRIISRAVINARQADLPLVLEPLPRSQQLPEDWVLDWVRTYHDWGAALLKLPYPGSAENCAEISALSSVPWVLLSAGVSFPEFADQLSTAHQTGATGYIAGRALWSECLEPDPGTRQEMIQQHLRPRLTKLKETYKPSTSSLR